MTTSTPRPTRALALTLRLLRAIERAGNRLPHPFWLFTIMAAVVIALSVVLNALDVSAVSPADDSTVEVRSLLSTAGVHMMIGDAITNYATFPPLALIMAVMLGVSVAERSGLLSAMLRGGVTRVPAKYLTFALALTGVTGSVASDAAYVVLIPLGALAFKAVGRNPILGLIVAFAATSAGYNASLLVTPTDAVLAGLTTSATTVLGSAHAVTPLANYFFSAASAVVLALLVTLVTETVLTRRTAELPPDGTGEGDEDLSTMRLTPLERRGLRNAGLTLLVAVAAIAGGMVPPASPLRGENGAILDSPVINGIAVILGLLFLLVGVAYGRTVASLTRARDIPNAMVKGVADLAPVLVLFFAASQFLAYFQWSKMGEVLAIHGADLLKSAGVPPLVLFVGMIAITAVMNLLITSGSAQWALIGPVFVPMFLLLGVAPETTQAVFRIADSTTNTISPMSPYFVVALGFLQRYRTDAGIGTLLSLTLPISLTLLISWTLFFLAWWALGIPLGPGVPVR